MFKPVFTGAVLVLAVVLFAAVGCQQQADPDSKVAATAKSREVSVEITGMS